MQNTNNDNKHRYKLHVILRSVLILECDFRFNFNLKLNNLVQVLFSPYPKDEHAQK